MIFCKLLLKTEEIIAINKSKLKHSNTYVKTVVFEIVKGTVTEKKVLFLVMIKDGVYIAENLKFYMFFKCV